MRQAVATRLEQLGQAAEAEVLAGLERHRDLLLAWNHSAHLISRADQSPARLVRHYLDSIEAVPLLPTQGPLVDVGSGGGFPGLIWSLLRPRQKVVLVEREARKAAFLRDAAQQLSLDRLTVEQEQISRPEQLMARKAAVLTSRAAGMSDLLVMASLLTSPSPLLFLYLGQSSRAEETAQRQGFVTRRAVHLGPEGGGRLVVLEPPEIGATPRETS